MVQNNLDIIKYFNFINFYTLKSFYIDCKNVYLHLNIKNTVSTPDTIITIHVNNLITILTGCKLD